MNLAADEWGGWWCFEIIYWGGSKKVGLCLRKVPISKSMKMRLKIRPNSNELWDIAHLPSYVNV